MGRNLNGATRRRIRRFFWPYGHFWTYKLKEWKRDDHAAFGRNDVFFRGPPLLDNDIVRIVPNPSVQFQMLKSGEVDLHPSLPQTTPKQKRLTF